MKITQDDAIKIKAIKLVCWFKYHNKNLTKMQYNLVGELYDVISDWKYVREHLNEYNLGGIRKKED